MEGPVRIAVTSRSLFDGGDETLHFSGAGILRPTAAGWDLPYTAACRENGAALALYRKLGFAETGNADDEEIELAMRVNH